MAQSPVPWLPAGVIPAVLLPFNDCSMSLVFVTKIATVDTRGSSSSADGRVTTLKWQSLNWWTIRGKWRRKARLKE